MNRVTNDTLLAVLTDGVRYKDAAILTTWNERMVN